MTNSYIINGTTLSLQPASGKWNDRQSIGIDGNGHAVYPGNREFEMSWEFMSTSEFNQLRTFYLAIGNTGTAVVNIPEYAASTWVFKEYSGTVLREPEAGQYFEQYVSSVKMLIVKITT